MGTFNSRESLSSTKNHHLDDENYYFDDDKGDGPVGRGSRPPSAVESSRSSYLEMLEPISEYFIMIIIMLMSIPYVQEGKVLLLIYLRMEQISARMSYAKRLTWSGTGSKKGRDPPPHLGQNLKF